MPPRALFTALLATALLAGSFDLHPHAEYPVPVSHDVPVYTGAAHPHQAPHVEDAGNALAVRCPACLLHLQTQASTDRGAPRTALPAPSGAALTAEIAVVGGAVRLSGGSRAPPSA